MLKIFLGYDDAQPISYHVARASIERRSSVPVSITPLILEQLPIKRRGLTKFTFTRFLVPHLCDYDGYAIFMDSDMLCLSDINYLMTSAMQSMAGDGAVAVSKNDQKFEWASLMVFDCKHESNRVLNPHYIETAEGLHHLKWLPDNQVCDLPRSWNFLAGYDDLAAYERSGPNLIHYTQGLPIYPETDGTPYAQAWRDEHKAMNFAEPWVELMGRSVHAAQTVDGRLVAKLHRDAVR